MFHLDKSGKNFNDEHLANIYSKLITFIVFHLDISVNDFNEEHEENI